MLHQKSIKQFECGLISSRSRERIPLILNTDSYVCELLSFTSFSDVRWAAESDLKTAWHSPREELGCFFY